MQNLDIKIHDLKTYATSPLKLSNLHSLPQDMYIFLYCLSGSFMFYTEADTYIIQPNQLVLLPPKFASSCHSLPGHPLSVLAFPLEAYCHGKIFFEFFALNQNTLTVTVDKEKVLSVYNDAISHAEANMPMLSQLAYNVSAVELCTIYMQTRIALEKYENEFTDVLSYIHNNLDKDLSLDELGALLHYNPVHFSQKFKEKMGLSPMKYLSQLRIKKAAHLLHSTAIPISEIAGAIGFSSTYSFRTFFSKHVGLSPQDYRCKFTIE